MEIIDNALFQKLYEMLGRIGSFLYLTHMHEEQKKVLKKMSLSKA